MIKIPETYAEAKGSPQRADWKGACGNETDNLREYSVYTQVPLSSVPKGDKILSTKYQYSRRSWTDGSKPAWLSGDMVRKQATTMAGAMHQYAASGASACYSPLAAKRDVCHIHQRDVVGAFLNAPSGRDVYVRPALGEATTDPSTGEAMVYKPERSLYGLSPSPVLWNDTLDATLTLFGWKRTQSDPCVYYYTDGATIVDGTTIVILTVYVDDFLLAGEDQHLVDNKKKELTNRFEMTYMGEVKSHPGHRRPT